MKIISKYILIAISLGLAVTSCSLFEPVDENLLGEDRLNYDPTFAEGLLLNAYDNLVNQTSFNDAVTDDAVNNNMSGYRKMADGDWNAQSAHTNRWGHYERIIYINKFINVHENVQWVLDSVQNQMFIDKMYGEAIALRAIRHFWILQEHSGYDESGNLLGVPYIKDFLEYDANFNMARLSFDDCYAIMMDEFDEALEYLPLEYDGNFANAPDRYADVDPIDYQFVFDEQLTGRVNGLIVKAFKAKLALLAASPAYYNGANSSYETAATSIADVLNVNGGISGIHPEGYYDFYQFEVGTRVFPEVLWRSTVSTWQTWIEDQQFPPSLNGTGRLNPSQNLVDAFPFADGTPFSTSSDQYDASSPYANRDPRLKKYIIYNGNDFNGRVIYTGTSAGVDGIDAVAEQSTRSGYYMKKLLDPTLVISADGTKTASEKFSVHVRYTDLYLMLAEAANEIGGPDYKVDGMSAREIIGALRARAGVGADNGDAYLASISGKDDMRTMIRNERRIELCFEGYRYYDLRRWKAFADVEDTQGMMYDNGSYKVFDLDTREYPSHANYAPIPNSEVVKFDALQQNAGW